MTGISVEGGNGNKNVLVLKFSVAYPLLLHHHQQGKKISREQNGKGERNCGGKTTRNQ
jgi:hypothetical protein